MLKELIRALYKIRDAISGNSKDTASNATLFDGIKMLYDKDVDESFMPVAIVNLDFILGQTEESGFLLLKETPIDTALEDYYILLYDKSVESNASAAKSTKGGSPSSSTKIILSVFSKPTPDSPAKTFDIDTSDYEHTIEINGTTYYCYYQE